MPVPASPQERLARVEDAIQRACAAASRARSDVTLIAVSKEHPDTAVDALYALGLRDFGENKVQALQARKAQVGRWPDARWHLIGSVQTNKSKNIANIRPELLHTIDRPALVDALERRLTPPPQACLIEVNLDAEAQKAGVAPAALDALLDHLAAAPHLACHGLMAIPDPTRDVAQAFAHLRRLGDRFAHRFVDPDHVILSMGMSDDFPLAIQHGATHIRVGTALFGPRHQTESFVT